MELVPVQYEDTFLKMPEESAEKFLKMVNKKNEAEGADKSDLQKEVEGLTAKLNTMEEDIKNMRAKYSKNEEEDKEAKDAKNEEEDKEDKDAKNEEEDKDDKEDMKNRRKSKNSVEEQVLHSQVMMNAEVESSVSSDMGSLLDSYYNG